MPQFLPELFYTLSIGLACTAIGYRKGLSKGLKKRSRLHILQSPPTVKGRPIASGAFSVEN